MNRIWDIINPPSNLFEGIHNISSDSTSNNLPKLHTPRKTRKLFKWKSNNEPEFWKSKKVLDLLKEGNRNMCTSTPKEQLQPAASDADSPTVLSPIKKLTTVEKNDSYSRLSNFKDKKHSNSKKKKKQISLTVLEITQHLDMFNSHKKSTRNSDSFNRTKTKTKNTNKTSCLLKEQQTQTTDSLKASQEHVQKCHQNINNILNQLDEEYIANCGQVDNEHSTLNTTSEHYESQNPVSPETEMEYEMGRPKQNGKEAVQMLTKTKTAKEMSKLLREKQIQTTDTSKKCMERNHSKILDDGKHLNLNLTSELSEIQYPEPSERSRELVVKPKRARTKQNKTIQEDSIKPVETMTKSRNTRETQTTDSLKVSKEHIEKNNIRHDIDTILNELDEEYNINNKQLDDERSNSNTAVPELPENQNPVSSKAVSCERGRCEQNKTIEKHNIKTVETATKPRETQTTDSLKTPKSSIEKNLPCNINNIANAKEYSVKNSEQLNNEHSSLSITLTPDIQNPEPSEISPQSEVKRKRGRPKKNETIQENSIKPVEIITKSRNTRETQTTDSLQASKDHVEKNGIHHDIDAILNELDEEYNINSGQLNDERSNSNTAAPEQPASQNSVSSKAEMERERGRCEQNKPIEKHNIKTVETATKPTNTRETQITNSLKILKTSIEKNIHRNINSISSEPAKEYNVKNNEQHNNEHSNPNVILELEQSEVKRKRGRPKKNETIQEDNIKPVETMTKSRNTRDTQTTNSLKAPKDHIEKNHVRHDIDTVLNEFDQEYNFENTIISISSTSSFHSQVAEQNIANVTEKTIRPPSKPRETLNTVQSSSKNPSKHTNSFVAQKSVTSTTNLNNVLLDDEHLNPTNIAPEQSEVRNPEVSEISQKSEVKRRGRKPKQSQLTQDIARKIRRRSIMSQEECRPRRTRNPPVYYLQEITVNNKMGLSKTSTSSTFKKPAPVKSNKVKQKMPKNIPKKAAPRKSSKQSRVCDENNRKSPDSTVTSLPDSIPPDVNQPGCSHWDNDVCTTNSNNNEHDMTVTEENSFTPDNDATIKKKPLINEQDNQEKGITVLSNVGIEPPFNNTNVKTRKESFMPVLTEDVTQHSTNKKRPLDSSNSSNPTNDDQWISKKVCPNPSQSKSSCNDDSYVLSRNDILHMVVNNKLSSLEWYVSRNKDEDYVQDWKTHNSTISSGFIKINGGQVTDMLALTKYSITYLILEGCATVRVQHKKMDLFKQDRFFIPLGVEYSIENPTKDKPLILFYYKNCN